MKDQLKTFFNDYFGYECDYIYFSPSRINLIGEHIDYNGGCVFPCAIEIGTYGAAKKRSDGRFVVYSKNLDVKDEFSIEDIDKKSGLWSDYVKGMLCSFKQRQLNITGMDLFVYGNIPNGSGLSSSASLEMLIGLIQNHMANDNMVEDLEIVLMGKETENKYIGVNSGVMDQFAIQMGKKDCGSLIDTNELTYVSKPINLPGCKLVILNTNKRRELKDSKYNERVKECNDALELLKFKFNIDNLCQLKVDDLPEIRKILVDDILYKRAKHVITENDRVSKFIDACENNDVANAGKILIASHMSLKDDYEVTGKELDTIVDCSNNYPACLGSRMTGAGFGGCAIAIVYENEVDEFIRNVGKCYKSVVGYDAEFIITNVGDGPHLI